MENYCFVRRGIATLDTPHMITQNFSQVVMITQNFSQVVMITQNFSQHFSRRVYREGKKFVTSYREAKKFVKVLNFVNT